MYSWMPKLGDHRSKCSAAPMHTGRQVRRAVAAGAHLVQRGEVGDAAQVRDAAGVHDGGADVVDQLLLDQLLAVPDGVEHLAHRDAASRCAGGSAGRPPGSRPASGPPSRTGGRARATCRAARPRSASGGGARRAAGARSKPNLARSRSNSLRHEVQVLLGGPDVLFGGQPAGRPARRAPPLATP